MTITIHKNAVSMWHPINGRWTLLSQTIGDDRRFYTNGIEIDIPTPPYEDEIARLRAELVKYKQYVLELDRELQTGEPHAKI